MEKLVDRFGRVHKDLRISVTDRCNFRCQYCMPEEGMEWLDRSEVLSFDEITRIATVLSERFGLESIRLTGGEPTLRKDLHLLVAQLSELDVELSMTTNGSTLRQQAEGLRMAGLDRINISLDTLNSATFEELTRRDQLGKVLDGIEAASAVGFEPVKVNVVLMSGINDDEIVDFLEFGRTADVTVRFIEFMPLDADEGWSVDRVVPAARILEVAAKEFDFKALERRSSPAERFQYRRKSANSGSLGENAYDAEFGIIASVSEPFCGTCDRVRLTSDGQLRNCLFALEHLDLRAMLRSGASDAEVARAIAGEVDRKRSGHAIGQVHFIRPTKSMSQVGG